MSNPEFDWTSILPEAERKKVLADRADSLAGFMKGFPVKQTEITADDEELRIAGIEGREAFERACRQVDRAAFRKALHTLIADATDQIGAPDTIAEVAEALAMTKLIEAPAHSELETGK